GDILAAGERRAPARKRRAFTARECGLGSLAALQQTARSDERHGRERSLVRLVRVHGERRVAIARADERLLAELAVNLVHGALVARLLGVHPLEMVELVL